MMKINGENDRLSWDEFQRNIICINFIHKDEELGTGKILVEERIDKAFPLS